MGPISSFSFCTYWARTLHVPYICFGTYMSCFGKSTIYAVQICVRTCLALAYCHQCSFIVIGISFRTIFLPPWKFCQHFVNFVIFSWWTIPFPLHTFCLSHRIILPSISASNEKVPLGTYGKFTNRCKLDDLIGCNFFCQPGRFSCQGSTFSNFWLLAEIYGYECVGFS